MMFKRFCMLAFLPLLLLWCLPMGALASQEIQNDNLVQQLVETEAKEPDRSVVEGGGDILLVYPDGVTEKIRQNVGFLADAATCLNKKMVFVRASEAMGHLEKYPYVICYALTGRETELMRELHGYQGETCILGGEFLKEYLGLPEKEKEASGILQYSFTERDSFEASVELDTVPEIQREGQARQSGTILLREGEEPFFARTEDIAYCLVTDFSNPILQEALIRELAYWQWPYLDAPPSYAQYLVLDEIYPFMPAEKLMDWVQLCIDSNIPFVMDVMPIYQNSEFPAMQQFCEVLKYAQANGGTVILHAPIMHSEMEDYAAFREIMTRATLAYTDRGVYPLGLAVPRSWTWDPQMLEFMRRYRTVFVCGAVESEQIDLAIQTNLLQQNFHQLIMPARALDGTGMSYLTSYSSAIYIDVRQDIRELEDTIENLRSSAVPLKSLWDMDHSVWADNFHLSCTASRIEINDQQQPLTYIPQEYPQDFAYNRNTLQRITVSLKSQNQKLLIAGTVATILFLIMIFVARVTVIHYFRRRNKLPKKRKFHLRFRSKKKE